jgi:hypothetical protein
MFQAGVIDKIKTQISFSVTFFSENLTVFQIMWKNMVQPDRPQMIIQYGACALHAR